MSTMLNLVDRVLANARHLFGLGRTLDAQRLLHRLCSFRELPSGAAEETQALLAEAYLKQRRYRKARRHLTAALRHQPDSARYHYLMASALDADDRGDAERALEHYRRSLELDRDDPDCLAAFGTLAVCRGQAEEGLRSLRRAVELRPEDPGVVQKLAVALRLADRPEEARAALLAARFRAPHDARFRRLWDDFRFEELHGRQRETRHRRAQGGTRDDGPVLLPFRRPQEQEQSARPGWKIVRRDPPAPPRPPHSPKPSRLSDRRHAQ